MAEDGNWSLLDVGARVGFTRHIGGVVTTELLADRCGIRPGLRVLEVGCGTGRTAAHLVETTGCRVVASDRLPGMLRWAQRHVADRCVADRVEVVQADVRDLPWDDDAFDVVICESVLVWVDDKAAAIAEMVRVARPGGIVGLNEGTLFGDEVPDAVATYADDALGGLAFERSAEWVRLLHGAGLERVSAEERPFRARDELRSIVAWIGLREYLTFVARLVRLYREEPDLRDLLRGGMAAPRHVKRHMGAGIYVGEVPAAG